MDNEIASSYTIEKIKKSHTRDISTLLQSRDMLNAKHLGNLPKLGMILKIDNEPAVAAFLRKIEGGSYLLDGLITNPKFSPKQRDYVTDLLIDALLTEAQTRDIKHIIAFSTVENTLMRASRFGFVELPHKVISLTLS